MTTATPAESVPATMEQAWECMQWLWNEADLLDTNRMHEWRDLLTPDIDYRAPIRVTRERSHGAGFSDVGYHLYEDFDSLSSRINRFDGDFAWAEDPPSRTRRMVSNIRARVGVDGTYFVSSNFMIFRSRLASVASEFLAGERQDELVRDEGALKLRRRCILLDHTTLPNKNLAVFF